ncbi:MAG: M55 family metallopeptidase [Archangium sp.]
MRVLLVADLEGIPQVDQATALIIGGEGNEAAIEAMHRETLKVVNALHGLGVDHIRISDAHRSGAPFNLDATRFPKSCELRFTEDMYGGELLDDVQAVCAVGMHARPQAGGFAGHTVSLHTDWSLGARRLDESQLAQLLASERGVPMWFTCGDDVLARDVADRMPCVITKHSRSATETKSLPEREIDAQFAKMLKRRNTTLPPVPREPLTITFQHRDEADAAVEAGATRANATSIVIAPRATFFEQYTEALHRITPSEAPMGQRFTAIPGTGAFARQLADLLAVPWERP